jgi:group I intron endonuclease
MVVYKIVNLVNGKLYIGKTIKTVEDRFSRHYFQPASTPLHRALRKYGRECFDVSVIDSAETDKELCEKERYWISFYDCKAPNGYNLTDGGDGSAGYKMPENLKTAIKKRMRGNKHFLGKRHSEETKNNMSLIKRGNTARLGMPHKDSTKKLIGLSHAGGKSVTAKLLWADVNDARSLYDAGIMNCTEISNMYGVTQSTMHSLLHRKTWKEYVI